MLWHVFTLNPFPAVNKTSAVSLLTSVFSKTLSRKKSTQVKLFESSGIKRRFTLKKLVSLGFLFPPLLIDAQLSMHNRKALRTNVGLWPSRERADQTVSQRHYCPIKDPWGGTSSSHQHTPNTQLKKKTFKFSPLSWAEINQNSICSAWIPTGQVIAHQSSDR